MADIVKKLAAVVFLTMLIWAWAYLALEKPLRPQPTGTIDISPAIRRDLFVSFENQPGSVSLTKLEIKGPPSQIAELKKRLHASDDDPTKIELDFLYDPESQGHSTPGPHVLNVVKFLNESDKLKDMAVKVVSCKPATINVKVEKLVKKKLTIQCLDVHNAPLTKAIIVPASIQMFVHGDWIGDLLTATVILTEAEIAKAREEPVTKRPFIELAQGKQRLYKDPVDIKLPSTKTQLEPSPINLTLGYIFSTGMQGKYEVNLTNDALLRQVNVRGTVEAIKAYQDMKYQILIEIHDGDENAIEALHRPVIYNFPDEFKQKGEIELAKPLVDAIFKVVPISKKP